ncbi:MAG: low molecular weight phosphatase family protein [Phocaeicola sp.]
MKILIVSRADNSIGPMARAYLLSFDHTFQVESAAIEVASQVNEEAIAAMKENGLNISYYSPSSVETYLHESWDCVVILSDTIHQDSLPFSGKVKEMVYVKMNDPMYDASATDSLADQFRQVRGELYQALRKLYREKLMDEPSCSCGANYFCKCE